MPRSAPNSPRNVVTMTDSALVNAFRRFGGAFGDNNNIPVYEDRIDGTVPLVVFYMPFPPTIGPGGTFCPIHAVYNRQPAGPIHTSAEE